MKQKHTKKQLVLGVALVCVATASAALTLGRARGAVLLGQPLSLTIAVQADTDDAATDLCFDADVYYGDNRQEGGRVVIAPVRQESGAPTAVRVNVATPIDEPVVTVYLRSGCGQKTSRKYVLLSELASDVAPALPAEILARLARAPQPAAVTEALTPTPAAPAKPSSSTAKPLNPAGVVQKRTNATPRPDSPRTAVVLKPVTPPRPRLKLSILDLVDIKDPSLKLSDALGSPPSDDPQKRSDAIALWRSLNTSPQDLINNEAQQKALSNDLKSLRDISDKNQKVLQELSVRLQQAESERYSNPVVYALGALLLMAGLALIALFLKLRRSGESSPWWRSGSHSDGDDGAVTHASHLNMGETLPRVQPTATAVAGAGAGAASARKNQPSTAAVDFSNSDLDIDLDLNNHQPTSLSAPQPVQLETVAAPPRLKRPAVLGAQRDFSRSLHASLHAINTQDMLDVRQKADFFMTLGQHEEAINLLEDSIRDSETSNPLVYLDLLKILHTLSRKQRFDSFRTEFNEIFTGRAADYASFGQSGNSLDAYPQICNEIAELCGSDEAVGFLEQCMVRRPEDASEMYFDLDAFSDLLLLHAVANRISTDRISDSGLIPFTAIKMAVTPEPKNLNLIPATEGTVEEAMPAKAIEPATMPSVDLDLSSSDHHLIDFDVSGLTVNLPPTVDQPPKR